MKRLTDDELMSAHLELLVLRLSVFDRRLSMQVQESHVSPGMQSFLVNSIFATFGLAGAYAAAVVDWPQLVGGLAGLMLASAVYKPISKYYRVTKPQRSVAELRKCLERVLEYEELHRPLALIVAEAIKTEGADSAHFDKALARFNAGELDALSFAAEALALAPQCWRSVCKRAYHYHFKKAELVTSKVEKKRANAPAPTPITRVETQIVTPDGVNLSYSIN